MAVSPRTITIALLLALSPSLSMGAAAQDEAAAARGAAESAVSADKSEAREDEAPKDKASETATEASSAQKDPPPSAAKTASGQDEATKPPTAAEICSVIRDSADNVQMDRDFFARLIWKESRFDVKAVSPVGARGIAQFMPYTAKERGLANPYDYEEAIRHSALYLRDLKAELGNWGLAAAAYNGGINRVKGWMAETSTRSLPYETVEYVNAITFRPVEWFTETGREVEPRPLDKDLSFDQSCARLPIMKTRAVFASLDGSESVPMKPWGVQVAGHANRSVAVKMFSRVRSAYGSVIGGKDPLVIRSRNASRQPIYAVRIGADSRSEADGLCGRLRKAGGSCIVMKN
ncbi:lytic transglycosylase domain-containing protein [Fulvimarina manganoxydans]|uniref:lytic transglycosylase domain-containing protein n=1 Tax=Fulvimarina manganoxydans TaxID=937218 RepID=UPI0023539EB4|nr:lytic transglycosylase domain-containing protein [Fulvimarina manganoxydans]